MVRAKFYVSAVTEYQGGGRKFELMPVTSGSEENKSFWKYTPSGKIEINVSNESVATFEVGKEYYVDFSSVATEEKEGNHA